MRHRVSGRKFSRPTAQRKALLRGLVRDLLLHESIQTTEAKAKEARPTAEKMITLGKDGTLHARRQALAFLNDKKVVSKLFEDVAPRYSARKGGYTRIIKIGFRGGDGAPVAQLELLPAE
jgi:large subunit ribosomal protein L17